MSGEELWIGRAERAEEANERLAAENAQLRQRLAAREETVAAADSILAEHDRFAALCEKQSDELAQLRQQLEGVQAEREREAAEFTRIVDGYRARLQTLEGERDALNLSWHERNERGDAFQEQLKRAQRENGALRGALVDLLDAAREAKRERMELSYVDIAIHFAERALSPCEHQWIEADNGVEHRCMHCKIPKVRRRAALSAPASPTAPPSPNCDTTKGPCACGAWHSAAPVQDEYTAGILAKVPPTPPTSVREALARHGFPEPSQEAQAANLNEDDATPTSAQTFDPEASQRCCCPDDAPEPVCGYCTGGR